MSPSRTPTRKNNLRHPKTPDAPGALPLQAPPTLAPALLRAYRNTDYVVERGEGLTLHVGCASAEAAAWLTHDGVRRGLLITACNPFSVDLDPAINEERMQWLDAFLQARGLEHWPALGRDPTGEWPPELSRFVLDPTDRDIVDLLVRGQQHASVIVTASGAVLLVLHPVHVRRESRHRYACSNGEHLVSFEPTDNSARKQPPGPRGGGGKNRVLICRVVPHNGGVVVAHEHRAQRIARIHGAIKVSKTWAEFRKAMPAQEYSAIVSWYDKNGEPRPRGSEEFCAESLPGWSEGDYPPWLQQEMESILPRDLLECHGDEVATHVNGDYSHIPGRRIHAFIADLNALGWSVRHLEYLHFH